MSTPITIELPALPWPKKALAPHISEETIDYHYGKHHQAYVTKLNGFIKAEPAKFTQCKTVLDVMMQAPAGSAVFNNAAQVWNHTFYWQSMSPNGGGAPTGAIADAITKSFGSFEAFKQEFSAAAAGHFGSGWAWLVKKADGNLAVVSTHDAGNPLKENAGKPLLTCDVWEHAYYVDYRNNRASYIDSWWKVINWEWANKKLAE